jgi:hypothetical protein
MSDATPFANFSTLPYEPEETFEPETEAPQSSAQAEYDELKEASAAADKAGDAAEVARIKPLKIAAFEKYHAAKHAAAKNPKK